MYIIFGVLAAIFSFSSVFGSVPNICPNNTQSVSNASYETYGNNDGGVCTIGL